MKNLRNFLIQFKNVFKFTRIYLTKQKIFWNIG